MSSSKLVLYSYFLSSCSWRVRIALAHKGVQYDYKAIDLLDRQHQSEEFKKVNPMAQVPALVVDGKVLTQSLSIMEYLEEAYPQKPLLPTDPLQRAKVREVCEVISSGIQPLQNMFVAQRVGEDRMMDWAAFYINTGFVALEKILKDCAGNYSVGDELTMADCCLVPQVFNARNRYMVDMAPYPTIRRVDESLGANPAVAAAHPNAQPDSIPGLV